MVLPSGQIIIVVPEWFGKYVSRRRKSASVLMFVVCMYVHDCCYLNNICLKDINKCSSGSAMLHY